MKMLLHGLKRKPDFMHNGTWHMITHDMLGHISIYDVVHHKEWMNFFSWFPNHFSILIIQYIVLKLSYNFGLCSIWTFKII